MGDFSADWLTLREPADAAARSARLTRAVADVVAHDRVLQVLDLGTGSGSNLRYLTERLPGPQSWLLVDHDPMLLADLRMRMSSWALARGYTLTTQADRLLLNGERLTCQIETRRTDLATLCDRTLFSDRSLVTASALLDLVSEQWLHKLAVECRSRNATVLFALTYDGRIRCVPDEPEDVTIQELVNRHQRTDKGFGAAVGPEAVDLTERCFGSLGYHVEHEPSVWVLMPDARELQRQLIDGWADAASAIAPEQTQMVKRWRARRLAHAADGRSTLHVGHRDLAAWLPRT